MTSLAPSKSVCPGCGLELEVVDGPTHDYIGASPACWALYGQVLALDVTQFMQTAVEWIVSSCRVRSGPRHQNAQSGHLAGSADRLLRTRRQRPRRRRAAEKGDEIAPFHVVHHVAPAACCPAYCATVGATAASLGTATILGSRIVKIDPRPGSLATVMSPPII